VLSREPATDREARIYGVGEGAGATPGLEPFGADLFPKLPNPGQRAWVTSCTESSARLFASAEVASASGGRPGAGGAKARQTSVSVPWGPGVGSLSSDHTDELGSQRRLLDGPDTAVIMHPPLGPSQTTVVRPGGLDVGSPR
jgi:hypothetical protein